MDRERLTVLHIDTERGWRGGERQVFWLARALGELGHRSLLAARAGEPLGERASETGIELVPCAPLFEFDPVSAGRLRRTIRRRGVQVVHAHTGHSVSLAALARRGTAARMVLTRRVDFRLRDNAFTRWKYRQADRIIAISEAVAAAMAASGIARERIEVIPSGIDLARRVAPASPERLAQLGVPPGSPLVVQVAQLVPHKDPLTFVRAIARARREVPQVHAVMAGEGALRADVEREIAALGLSDCVHVPGYLPDADALIAAARVVTLSSQEEGLGTVLLDALSAGVPVAATAAGGIPEIVQDGVSGLLVPVHDAERLGACVVSLLADAALHARLADGARRRAADFSVARTAQRTLEVYRAALAGGPAGSGDTRPGAATR